MAKLTTRQALNRLLNSEDYELLWLQSGFTKEYRRKLRYKFKKQEISTQLQEDLLTQCGFSVVIEKRWQKA